MGFQSWFVLPQTFIFHSLLIEKLMGFYQSKEGKYVQVSQFQMKVFLHLQEINPCLFSEASLKLVSSYPHMPKYGIYKGGGVVVWVAGGV